MKEAPEEELTEGDGCKYVDILGPGVMICPGPSDTILRINLSQGWTGGEGGGGVHVFHPFLSGTLEIIGAHYAKPNHVCSSLCVNGPIVHGVKYRCVAAFVTIAMNKFIIGDA